MWSKREYKYWWTLVIVLYSLILYPIFALEAKDISASEPVVTWNLFLTLFLVPLSVSILGLFFNKKLDKQNEGWKLYHEEVKEHQKEWRESFAKTMCGIKQGIDCIETELMKKAGVEDYKKVQIQLGQHGERILTLELAVKVIEKNGD